MRLQTIQKRIQEGGLIPRWYGVAYDDWSGDHVADVVCYPIGINLMVAAGRCLYYGLVSGKKTMRSDPRAAYCEGFRAGRASVK